MGKSPMEISPAETKKNRNSLKETESEEFKELPEFKEGSRNGVRQSRWSISISKVTFKSATTAIADDHRRF